MFEPLVLLAKKVLFDPDSYTPAVIIDAFSEMAKRFGIAAEVFNQAGSKVTLETLSSILLEFSPMWKDLSGISTDRPNKEITKQDDLRSGVYKYLTGALAMTDKMQNWPLDIPGRSISSISLETLESVTRSLWFIGGIGRGAQLPPREYEKRSYDMSLVEWAIKALIDPSLLPENSKRSTDLTPLYEDAYALAVAYISYLYYSKDDASYDSVFSMLGTLPQAMTRVTKMQTTARRVAWHYAALATSCQMSDLSISVTLLQSALDFFEPLLTVKTSVLDDIKSRLTSVKGRITEFSFAPIADHTATLVSKYKSMVDADVILPPFVGHMLDLSSLSLPQGSPVIKQGSSGVDSSLMKTIWVKPDSVRNFIDYADTLSQAAVTTAESITNLMMYYYSTISEYNANALGLPADLLRDDVPVVKSNEVVYGSPFRKEFIQLSIPRYVYTDKNKPRKGEFIMSQYRFSIIKLAALREKLRATAGRFVWPHRVTLPVAASSAAKFATLPLPFTYVKELYYPSCASDEDELRAILKAAITPNSPISAFFEDATHIIAGDSFQRTGVINALAGLCLVYDPKKKQDIIPTCPTIYGYPTKAFIEAQDKDRTVIKVSTDNGDLHFKIHSHVPKPGKLLPTSFLLDSGVIISVNVLASVMLAGVANSKVASSATFDPKDLIGAKLIETLNDLSYKDIKEVAPMIPVEGWSTAMLPYPHVFFEYQMSLDNLLDSKKMLNFLHTRIQRGADNKGPLFIVKAFIREEFFAIEPGDDIDSGNAEFEPTDISYDTRFNPPTAKQPKPANKQPEVVKPPRMTPSSESAQSQADAIRMVVATGKTDNDKPIHKAKVITPESKLGGVEDDLTKNDPNNSIAVTGDPADPENTENQFLPTETTILDVELPEDSEWVLDDKGFVTIVDNKPVFKKKEE